MTTIRTLITEAFRENNLIQVGDTPSGAEYAEAERLLLRFITSLWGSEFGEGLTTETLTTSETTLPVNSRLLITDDSPDIITLSSSPQDGERFAVVDPRTLLTSMTIEAGVGTIENSESVTIDNTASEYEWFYRADKGNWYRVTTLTSDDECPLPEEFDDLLSIWLSLRLASRTGTSAKGESLQVYDRIKKRFSARYKQTKAVGSERGLLAMTNIQQRFYQVGWATGN